MSDQIDKTPDEQETNPDTPETVPLPSAISPDLFRKSRLTYLTLFFLIILWPVSSIVFVGDPAEALKKLSISLVYLVYLPTMVQQWLIFALIILATYRENMGLTGVGFQKIRLIDFLYALAFLLASNLLLSAFALLLKAINLEIPGELSLILPKNAGERILWAALSLTAGICEETAFRGYLMTRIKIIGRMKTWILPIIISSLAFGSGHAYQGIGGFIMLTLYGALFALLFIKSKSLWPCIIAHFFQDFSALFYPYQS
jgi:membrane protease YdiL (CAAX protease family)